MNSLTKYEYGKIVKYQEYSSKKFPRKLLGGERKTLEK